MMHNMSDSLNICLTNLINSMTILMSSNLRIFTQKYYQNIN